MKIAIIPARSNSQRIKNKNIISFSGKPIISWPIKIAKKSKIFSRVFVSTDSKKISKISKKFGAEVPFLRPKKISDHKTGILEVIKHAIFFLEKKILSNNLNFLFLVIYIFVPKTLHGHQIFLIIPNLLKLQL